MQCVRCLQDTAKIVAEAPDGSLAWSLFYCEKCHYSWRDSEPDYITDVSKRDPWAQIIDLENDLKGTKHLEVSDYKPKNKPANA